MADKLQNQQVKELTKYLAFFNSKKEESFKEIDLDFKDFIYDNLSESIFNKEDVESLIKKWNDQIKKNLSNDLSNMNRMSAIYLQYLFQQTGVEFTLNLNLLEDIKMIENMKKVEAGDSSSSLIDNSSSSTKNPIKTQGSKLPSLFESQKSDLNLLKIEKLEQQLEILQQENEKLKANGTLKIDDFSSEGEQVMRDELRKLNIKFEELSVEHKHLQEDSQKKLQESAQFNNLKKMIQQKNDQLKEIKDRYFQINLHTIIESNQLFLKYKA